MKRLTSYLSFACLFLALIVYACTSQRPMGGVQKTLPDSFGTRDFEKQWEKIEAFQKDEQPRSMIETAEKVYSKAYKNQNPVQQIKALITIQKARMLFEEEPELKNIRETKKKLEEEAYFPVRSIMHSLLAQQYFEYYRHNQYSVSDRSSTNVGNADPSTWGGATFYDTIAHHFLQSLKPAQKLDDLHVAAFAPLLTGDTSTRELRPSLLTLLSYRALNFFENDIPFKTLPVNQFLIDDPAFFTPAGEFANTTFATPDSLSAMFRATRIYQNLISHQINDSLKQALVHTSLQRLKAMHEKAAIPNKDSVYYQALEHLANNHPGNPVTAEVLYEQAQLVDQGYQPPDYSSNRPVKQIALSICEDAIEAHPGTYGARQCKVLKARIEKPELGIQAENTYIPREPSKFLLKYKEIDSVYYSIIPLTRKAILNLKQLQGEAMLDALKSHDPLYQLEKELPLPLDYREHRVEIGLPGLEKGTYAVLASSGKGYKADHDLLEVNFFQVTNLGLVQMRQRNGDGQIFYVLNAKNGTPEKEAGVEILKRNYNREKQGYDYNRTDQLTTDENGRFTIGRLKERAYLKIYQGADTFYPEDPIFDHSRYSRDRKQKRAHTFTDRSLYRPGQTIHFKTILIESQDAGTQQNPVAGETVPVKLRDVNNQEVASDTFETNEFGAFAGEFDIPEATLTGHYRIQTPFGSQAVSVEEYKRPQFEVKLKDIAEAYKLGEEVEITGNAATYSGVPLENGELRYQVKRKARFPYWYWRMPIPSTSEKIIKNGQTAINKDGSFSLNFTAKPDPTIDKSKQPVFRYEIKVTVTDETGETQTAQKSIKAGYAAYYPAIQMKEWQEAGKPLKVQPRIENAGGQAVDQNGHLVIQRLQQPSRIFREQYWETPDQYLDNYKSYKAKYPHDPYKDEGNPENWEIAETVVETGVAGNRDTTFNPESLNPGYYKANLTVTDASGDSAQTRKFFKVYRENEGSVAIKAFSYLIPLQTKVEPGEKARFIWGSADEEATAIVHAEHRGEIIQETKIRANKGQQIIEIPVEEQHRGNIQLHVFSANENRINTHHETIKVPWSNKNLDVKLETFRSTLEPGKEETWSLTIENPNEQPADAELLANMYDASLDAIKKHRWGFDIFPTFGSNIRYETPNSFSASRQSYLRYMTPNRYQRSFTAPSRQFEDLIFNYPDRREVYYSMQSPTETTASEPKRDQRERQESDDEEPEDSEEDSDEVRTELQETAFFKPQLRTNSSGEIQFTFESPEALTRWKVMFLAHDRDLANAYLEKEVVTQKQLMVEPYVPRFLRSGDQLKLTTKISNLTDSVLTGPVQLTLLDHRTGQALDEAFNLQDGQKQFTLEASSSKTIQWAINVPDTVEAVTYRITADGGKHKDGQEALLPILPQKEFVTESQPLWITGSGKQTFSFDRIAESQSSKTLRNHRITLEMASNPAWYAVQALPSIMEPDFDNTEQIFNAYYANSLASHIISANPEIQKVFRQWRDSGSLGSRLEKNQELKDVALEETPWLREARNETEMQQQLAELFKKEKVKAGLSQYLNKLKNQQLSNGTWPWFKGMRESRSITYYILGGLGKLKALNAQPENQAILEEIKGKALSYADESMQEAWQKIMERDTSQGKNYLHHDMVRYLYARSFYTEEKIGPTKAFSFWVTQAREHWTGGSLMDQAMIALAMHRFGETETAQKIMTSLEEKALHDEEMGMYWAANKSGYQWHEAPIETQALLIEAFKTIENDQESVEAMKAWLLKQKQVQSWKTSKATADACYALLMEGTDWLDETEQVQIKLNGETFNTGEKTGTEAGTGYFKHTWHGKNIRPEQFREIQLQKSSEGIAWGAVHWQYFENPEKITHYETPLSIKKQLYIQENTDEGTSLKPVKANTTLQKGDLIKVRMILESDRSMDFIHLKDHRASALEPVEQLSGYRYEGGLGYYRNIKDASANFFFDHLPKGTHVFEYNLRVSHDGRFQNGTARIQSMYAPEFNSHSEGRIIRVTQVE